MERFLQDAAAPPGLCPPFVVLLRTAADGAVGRSLVTGPALQDWFGSLVDTVLPRAGEMQPLLARCLTAHTLRLVAAASTAAVAGTEDVAAPPPSAPLSAIAAARLPPERRAVSLRGRAPAEPAAAAEVQENVDVSEVGPPSEWVGGRVKTSVRPLGRQPGGGGGRIRRCKPPHSAAPHRGDQHFRRHGTVQGPRRHEPAEDMVTKGAHEGWRRIGWPLSCRRERGRDAPCIGRHGAP